MIRTTRSIVPALVLALSAATAQAAADLTRYVAVGDTLTAAYTNGGLVDVVQENSFPALLHRQATGSTTFEQPLVSAPGIPHLWTLDSLVPVVINTHDGEATGAPQNLALPRPYDNLAVPGAKAHDVVATTSSPSNPLVGLVLRGLGTQLAQAASLDPTFATIWIGNNDVLPAAVSGVVIDGVTLTTKAVFEPDFRTIVDTLSANGARLAVGTIPDVTLIPYVTTLPRFVVNPQTGEPILGQDGTPVPLVGPDGPLESGDFVLLSASTHLKQGYGLPQGICPIAACPPLTNGDILSAGEVAAIRARTSELNGVITGLAAAGSFAVVDLNRTMADVAAHGITLGGVDFDAGFLTGGIFGYDGVHLTPFGYATVANEFIAAINRTFGNAIPLVDMTPFMFEGLPDFGGAPDGTVTANFRMSPEAVSALFRAIDVPTDLAGSGGTQRPRKPARVRKLPPTKPTAPWRH